MGENSSNNVRLFDKRWFTYHLWIPASDEKFPEPQGSIHDLSDGYEHQTVLTYRS